MVREARQVVLRATDCTSLTIFAEEHQLTEYSFFNLRTADDPGLFAIVVGGPKARERSLDPREKPLDTRDGLVEAFYKTTGRTDIEFGALKHASWWRPNIRMVDKFSEGRVFIAGGERLLCRLDSDSFIRCSDAAHTHSPAGGQGLNSSVQDGVCHGSSLALDVD